MSKVLIDVPETFKYFKQCRSAMAKAIDSGIVFDGLTNGEIIQKMFPYAKITEESYVVFVNIEECNHPFDKAWWNRKWGE